MPWRHEFRVIGHEVFPLDMLRYDHCFPAEAGESHKLSQNCDGETREVILAHLGGKTWTPPTRGRLRSVGQRSATAPRSRR